MAMADRTKVTKTYGPRQARPLTIKLAGLLSPGALRPCDVGDVVTDEDLQEACGINCSPGAEDMAGYRSLRSAMNIVLDEHSVNWQRVRGAGCVKVLTRDEQQHVGRSRLRNQSRLDKREVRRMQTYAIEDLSDAERNQHLVLTAQLSLMAVVGTTATRRKMEARKVHGLPDMGRFLAAIQGG